MRLGGLLGEALEPPAVLLDVTAPAEPTAGAALLAEELEADEALEVEEELEELLDERLEPPEKPPPPLLPPPPPPPPLPPPEAPLACRFHSMPGLTGIPRLLEMQTTDRRDVSFLSGPHIVSSSVVRLLGQMLEWPNAMTWKVWRGKLTHNKSDSNKTCPLVMHLT